MIGRSIWRFRSTISMARSTATRKNSIRTGLRAASIAGIRWRSSPQGGEPPTGHRCLGLDYATFLSVAFVALLVRGYDWELPPQDLEYNWQKLPPEPRDGLRVRLQAKGRAGPG